MLAIIPIFDSEKNTLLRTKIYV